MSQKPDPAPQPTPLAALDGAGTPNTLNVLVLDGGGVKGLSSLIILRSLLRQVERWVGDLTGQEVIEGSLLPHEVFNVVVGTSTGGLIALMVGKLGMSVDDCIDRYHALSYKIFRDGRHRRGTTLRGLMKPKYCGRHMREQINKLFEQRRHDAGLQMAAPGYTNCAVVCRRYDSGFDHRHRETSLADLPTVICSHTCLECACTICEAARATSAAPTYFSKQRIGNHVFIDGGMGFNNPSWAAYDHYNIVNKSRHPQLAWQGSRVINLGTGTRSTEYPCPIPRGVLGFVRMPKVLGLLRDIATNSELEAMRVKTLSEISDFEYQRFSADTGVCWIRMDDYQRLEDIENLTYRYLERTEVQKDLGRCAEGIAKDYVRGVMAN